MDELQHIASPMITIMKNEIIFSFKKLYCIVDDCSHQFQKYCSFSKCMMIRINWDHQLYCIKHSRSFVGFNSVSLSKAVLILLHTHWAHSSSTLSQRIPLLFASFHSLTAGLAPCSTKVHTHTKTKTVF